MAAHRLLRGVGEEVHPFVFCFHDDNFRGSPFFIIKIEKYIFIYLRNDVSAANRNTGGIVWYTPLQQLHPGLARYTFLKDKRTVSTAVYGCYGNLT